MRHFSWASVHTQFDELKPVLIKTISLPRPGRLRKYGKNSLVTVTGEGVVTLDVDTFKTTTLFKRVFDCPLGLGVGDNGLLWIGEGGATHQVTAYTSEGKEVARLGKKGRRKLGAWDENDLEEPAGVEVDAQGRVWVAEHTHWEKRVSIWDSLSCRCVKSILGPTQYGGDGCIDPENLDRLFYRGLEMRRDNKTGKITPVALI
jgi:sugar lactone lactonase YvrE